jgi:hypothetical protein
MKGTLLEICIKNKKTVFNTNSIEVPFFFNEDPGKKH